MTISLSDLKAHLRITDNADDALLQSKIDAAADWIAGYTGIPADSDTIPATVSEATCILAGSLFDYDGSLEGATAQTMPKRVLELLDGHRDWVF